MLSENLQTLRKAKGLSQEELAQRLQVVRQTVSKWEKGLSVPDADLLIRLSEVLETPVSALLGETVVQAETPDVQLLAEKLAALNEQLAQQKERSRRWQRAVFFLVAAVAAVVLFRDPAQTLLCYSALHSAGQSTAVIGGVDGPTAVFVTSAPLPLVRELLALTALIGAVVGICKTSKR